MGSVVPTALGLAAAQPDKRVVAFTGDSELSMGLSYRLWLYYEGVKLS